ncbi:GspE/PulE family protein [Geothrix sp. PMB-07]|uniref:GspE/PulE family protein n=1 Tax=Geothrix sp. PMB-07 TaxID=3068640 RepID=UPI0027415186|nr:GspE/PulE family protein [Geothrix sp. PMB-07]WLT30592.1 GspE/PulE family protein [Geothrix sp. PMB-07]
MSTTPQQVPTDTVAPGDKTLTDFRPVRDLYPTLDLTREPVDFALFQALPLDLMLKHHFVPVQEREGVLWLAMADPLDIPTQDMLRLRLKRPLRFAGAPLAQIQEVLKKSESGQKVMDEAGEALKIQVLHEEDLDDEVLDLERLTDKDEAPIVRLVDTTIFNALQRRASDIHLETTSTGFQIKYRIDGSLYPAAEPIDRRFASPIISRVKVMSELDIAEKRKPQDGRFKLKVRGRAIDFRVSIMPTIHGEDAVIRILDKENLTEEFQALSLEILGFSDHELKRLRRFAHEPYGMFLVTGPTGSGKTTTLYAVLSEIKAPEDKIITIEDPVEYQLEGVTQIPVNEKKGLTFALGLRSILRHDPDKILVGEIRDPETAQIAIQSALTGHLVFTTVHANNVLDVLGRFQHMGVEVYNFVSSLNCILAQRLVRVLCPKCKRPAPKPTPQELEENGVDEAWLRTATLFDRVGCVDCHGTGFRGRQAIIEFMGLNDEIRELLIQRAPVREVKAAARRHGMQFLRESAIEKVRMGITTFAEINKVTFREGA